MCGSAGREKNKGRQKQPATTFRHSGRRGRGSEIISATGARNSPLIAPQSGLMETPIRPAAPPLPLPGFAERASTRTDRSRLSDPDRKRTERLNSAQSFLSARLVLGVARLPSCSPISAAQEERGQRRGRGAEKKMGGVNRDSGRTVLNNVINPLILL